MNIRFFTALLAFAAAAAMAAPAGPTKVRIYGATIDIPDPPGLVALINKDSHYYRFAARLQSSNKNQLLASFLPAKEAAIADIDQLPSATHWGIVYGIDPAMNRSTTVAQFQAEVLPEVERNIAAAAADPAFRKKMGEGSDASVAQLGRELKIDAGKLRMGEVTPLGTFTKRDNYATFGAATRIRVERDGAVMEEPTITVIGFIVARERLFCIAVYRVFRDEKDVELARRDAATWADAITRANSAPP